MKWMLITIVVVAVVGLKFGPDLVGELGLHLTPPAHEADEPQSPPPAQRKIFAAGTVEGSQRTMELTFEIAGRVANVPIAEGQLVEEGDVLARLDDAIWQHKLTEAEARLELARAERTRIINGASEETREVARAEARLAAVQVAYAETEKNRAERLFAQDAISEQDVDNNRYEYDLAVSRYRQAWARVVEIEAAARHDDIEIADAKIRLAESEVDQARTMLAKTRLLAPISGQVLRIDVEPGELVNAERTEPVASLANAERLRVRAYVEELDALSVFCGQPAYAIADGRPDIRYAGTITWVAPAMGPKQHQHHQPGEHLDVEVREVLIALDDPQGLVIGLPVEVFIEPFAPEEPADPEPAAGYEATPLVPQPLATPSRAQRESVSRLVSPDDVFPASDRTPAETTLRITTAD